jgi:hypothetical protein
MKQREGEGREREIEREREIIEEKTHRQMETLKSPEN